LASDRVVVKSGFFPFRDGNSAADPGGIPLGAIRTFATALPISRSQPPPKGLTKA
jgi:hypothetical protein